MTTNSNHPVTLPIPYLFRSKVTRAISNHHGLNRFLMLILGLLVLLSPSSVLSEEPKTGQGYFVLCTKSEVMVYTGGKQHAIRDGKTASCEVSVGSIVIVRHKSPFVYDGAALAFVYRDRENWIPFNRSKMRVIDHTIDPKDVTATMIKESNKVPKMGTPGKDFVGKWPSFKLPNIGVQNWLGIEHKGVWCMSAFIVTEEMIQPLKPAVKPIVKEIPPAQILTQKQLSGIVVIEGDKGVGSGFLTKVNGSLCVVTNLHVLGNNKKFTIKTLAGQDVRVSVSHLRAAVDADIALLGLADGQEQLLMLTASKNVLDTTKIGNKIVVVGNRLGGGVATQTIGHVRGIGPTRIEVDAKFQSGNSGSPIYDIQSAQVVGVASYTETVPAKKITGGNLKNLDMKNETRWFGYRIDTVKKWQPLEWKKWRQQITSIEDYHNASMSALAILKGDFSYKHDDTTIQRLVTSFRNQKNRFGKNKKTADLFTTVARYLTARKKKIARMKFYNYFHTCPYWTTSLPQQNAFRDLLIEALTEASAEIRK